MNGIQFFFSVLLIFLVWLAIIIYIILDRFSKNQTEKIKEILEEMFKNGLQEKNRKTEKAW